MELTTTDRDFFLLLRTGLWQSTCQDGASGAEETLSSHPAMDGILRLACEQTVSGIVADGLCLYVSSCESERAGLGCDSFINHAAVIIRQNYKVNQVQAKVCRLLDEYVVLKGQGVAQCYPHPMLRCSGDIDLFFTPDNYQKAKALLAPLSGKTEDKPYSKECTLVIDGVIVELHGAMISGINPYADAHLQTMLGRVLREGDTRSVSIDGNQICLPGVNFDAIYILIHAIRHLGAFGISLRQVIDWTMHMHSNASLIDRERLQSDIRAMHLERLWTLFSSFAVNCLGAPKEDFETADIKVRPLSEEKSRREASLWQIIRSSGSFGRKNPYFRHLRAGRLEERFARIYYHLRQARAMREFDREFFRFLVRRELRDVLKAPFRFLFGGRTKITE